MGLGLPQRRELDNQPLISQGEEVVGLAKADVDGDGDDDLIVKNATPNSRSRLTWFERTASGLDPVPNDLFVGDFERFAVKDCGGDRIADALMWSRAFNGPIFLRGLGGGSFSALLDPIAGMLGQDRLDLNGERPPGLRERRGT